MRTIHKKCWPPEFAEVVSGKKKYDLRLADFTVDEGDVIVLEEWDPKTEKYTGRKTEVTVTMVRRTREQKYWKPEEVEKYGFQILQIEPPPPLRPSATPPQAGGDVLPGVYEHYKGSMYEVIGVARHSETKETLVVYRALYGDHALWVRPLAMFNEEVQVDGKKVPRFRFIGKSAENA